MKSILLIFVFILLENIVSTNIKPKDKKEKDPLAGLSDEELDKMMKEFGLGSSKDLGLGKSKSEKDEKKDNASFEKNMKNPSNIQDLIKANKAALNKFQLSLNNAFNLIELTKDYNFFNRLPVTAMNIISDSFLSKSYKDIQYSNKNRTDEMNKIISNTLNSQVFIDHENRLGRKGMLTLILKDTGDVMNVWSVLNNKVFSFFKSSNYLNIVKIYRVAHVSIKDHLYSPCFFLYYNMTSFSESQSLVCSLNIREKDYWMTTLNYHKDTYK